MNFFLILVKLFSTITIKEIRRWNFMTFWYRDFIPEKQLRSAIKWFANYKPEEKPILLMSDVIYGDLNNGFLVTNMQLYYRLKKSYKNPATTKILRLEDIQSISIKCKLFGAWLMINGEKEALISSYGKGIIEQEANVLREFMQILIKGLHENRLGYQKDIPDHN